MPDANVQDSTQKSGINWKSFLLGFIIGAILFGLFGVGFWYFTKSCKVGNSKTPAKTTTTSSKVATPLANTVTLKEFSGILYDSGFDQDIKTGHSHTLTFNYPSNWTVTEDDSKNPNSSGHFYLIGGTNSFTIQLSEIAGGIGGACVDTTVPADLVVSSEKITVNNQPLYATVEGSVSKKEVKDAYLDIDPTQNCMEGVVLLKVNSDEINFVTKMSFQGTVDKDYFLNSGEFKTAKEILSSIQVLN